MTRVDEDKKTERVAGIEAIEDAERKTRSMGYFAGDPDDEGFSLGTAHGGEAIKLLDKEMQLVAENILDRETKAVTARKITLTITIVPEENRSSARMLFECSSKLAGKTPTVATIGLGEDTAGNITVASHDVRQGVLKMKS